MTTGYSSFGVSINLGGSGTRSVLLDSLFVGDMSATDESSSSREIRGMMAPSAANNAKTWPPSATQLPWYKVKGNSRMVSFHYAFRLTFNNFPEGKDIKCFAQNPTDSDIVPPVEINDITFNGVHQDNIAGLNGWNWAKATIDNCGKFPCTGPDNHIFTLKSVTDDNANTPFSVSGVTDYEMINVNRTAGLYIETCEPKAAWGRPLEDVAEEFYTKKGETAPTDPLTAEQESLFTKPHLCHNNNIDLLICDSQDGDRMDRSVHPITVSRDSTDAPFSAVLNSFEDHVWDGFYTG